MLEGLWLGFDPTYAVGCELRHAVASFFLCGLPLVGLFLTLRSSWGMRGTFILPAWWWLGCFSLLGLALGYSLHSAIDFDWLIGIFPSGWA
jgi:hypothetical protein